MEIILNFINKIFLLDKEPIKIGLSQFKESPVEKKVEPSIKNKNVKPYIYDGEIEKMAEFIKDLKNVTAVKVLPYHKYAEMKYISLGIVDNSPERMPTNKEMETARELIKKISKKQVL